jgi:hypothetical protein
MVPKVAPKASPRAVVRIGLSLIAIGAGLLAALIDQGADADIVTVPFILFGAGFGMLVSQLGNVVVSAVPVEKSSEVGGLQYTAQSLGSSLGTAVIGAIVIGGLAGVVVQDLANNPEASEALVQAATIELQSGVDFVSNVDLEIALAGTELSMTDQQAILDANETARIGTLQNGAFMLALLAVLGLFASRGIPTSLRSVEDDDGELVDNEEEPAPD